MSTPPKPPSPSSLAPPSQPDLSPQQPPITPVRHDKDKENSFSPAALLLPCFRLVTCELQVTLEPMDRRQAQLHYIDYKLNALQGKQREGRKRRNVAADDQCLDPHDVAISHALVALDRENRPQQPRLTSPPRQRFILSAPPALVAISHSLLQPLQQPQSPSPAVAGSAVRAAASSTRTPSRKPLLPKFPPNPSMVAKANSRTPGRQWQA